MINDEDADDDGNDSNDDEDYDESETTELERERERGTHTHTQPGERIPICFSFIVHSPARLLQIRDSCSRRSTELECECVTVCSPVRQFQCAHAACSSVCSSVVAFVFLSVADSSSSHLLPVNSLDSPSHRGGICVCALV